MSDRYKSRSGERRHRSRSRSPSIREDWRNVRVKEEPLSDVEGRSSSSHRRSHTSPRRKDHDHRESGRRRSPPPTRPRSRSRERGGGGSRGDNYRGGDRDRDRDRGERSERPRSHIKTEPRSRSRSPPGEFTRPPPRHHHSRDDHNSRGDRRGPSNDQQRDSRRSPPQQRNIKREKDWDNFFNPASDMSRQALVKREENENERGERIEEFDKDGNKKEENIEKEKPNFGLSGKLTEETNTYRGVVIKYSEPPEARKPIKTRWRLYPFKDGEALEVMYIHRQSAYLLGRERKIADIPIDHPSCSKQHAVIQYRLVPYEKPNGMKGRRIRPYIIDLESANGTLVNGKKIDPKRYVELFEKDVLKFGFSSREYVLLHEHSKDDSPLDDDGYDKSPSPD